MARDAEGRITGYSLYEGDPDLAALTEGERALHPALAWLADGLHPLEARAAHPVIGPLDVLVDRWCERRDLLALSRVLPPYLQGPNGPDSWQRLLSALEVLQQRGEEEDSEVLERVVAETRHILRSGTGA